MQNQDVSPTRGKPPAPGQAVERIHPDRIADGPPGASALSHKVTLGGPDSLRYQILRDAGLPPRAKLVLLYLTERAGANGTCWPSLTCICAGTALGRRTAEYALSEAERAGWLSRKRRRRNTSVFAIHAPVEVQRVAFQGAQEVQHAALQEAQEVQNTEVLKCKKAHQEVQALAPKSVNKKNHSQESSSSSSSGDTTSATTTTKTQVVIEKARALLEDHSGLAVGTDLAAQVLHLVDGDLDLLRAYTSIAPRPRRGPGFYLADVPRRLVDARRHLAEQRAAAQRERETAQQPAEAEAPKRCQACQGVGFTSCFSPDGENFAWCRCAKAASLRERDPGLLERLTIESQATFRKLAENVSRPFLIKGKAS